MWAKDDTSVSSPGRAGFRWGAGMRNVPSHHPNLREIPLRQACPIQVCAIAQYACCHWLRCIDLVLFSKQHDIYCDMFLPRMGGVVNIFFGRSPAKASPFAGITNPLTVHDVPVKSWRRLLENPESLAEMPALRISIGLSGITGNSVTAKAYEPFPFPRVREMDCSVLDRRAAWVGDSNGFK